MRYFICLLLVMPLSVSAQKADSFRNSIGVFGETNTYFAWGAEMNTAGLQYVRKSKKWLSYKASIGYAYYQNTHEDYWGRKIQADTIMYSASNESIKLGILSIGIEAQRQFYKKLYFFTGFDVRCGYGKGMTDTFLVKEYMYSWRNPFSGNMEEDIRGDNTYGSRMPTTMTYCAFSPYVGLKVEYNRFSFGASLLNYWCYVSIAKNDWGLYGGLFDFDVSNISQQFFVRYKF